MRPVFWSGPVLPPLKIGGPCYAQAMSQEREWTTPTPAEVEYTTETAISVVRWLKDRNQSIRPRLDRYARRTNINLTAPRATDWDARLPKEKARLATRVLMPRMTSPLWVCAVIRRRFPVQVPPGERSSRKQPEQLWR
jgi:hypothetical protein